MYRKISPLGILVGLLVSQIVSVLAGIVLLVVFLFVYGNKVLVAFFEYPSSIVITMVLRLLSIFIGGYCSMLLSKKALINPFIVGVVSLVSNVWLMVLIDFKYGNDYFGLLIFSAILVIPSSVLGGHIYQRKNT